MEGKTGARGALRAALHVLFSVSLAAFAFSSFSAGLMELFRPLGPSLSAWLAVVSDYLDDRKFMFLIFCTALLVLVAGDARVVTSSGPGVNAGFTGDDISRGGYVWLAPGTLEGGAGALGGRTGLPGVGLPETLAVEGEERADELEEMVEEVEEEGNEEEDGEGRRDEQQEEEGEEEEGRKQEEQERQEGENEVDGEEFRRKCEDFIEKVKRERG